MKRSASGLGKFRVGEAPKPGEGLRIGVTRRPPRGVSKDKWVRSAESRQAVELIAAMSLRTPVSLGCFCEDETRCHRSRLFEVVSREAERLGGKQGRGSK